MFTGECRIPGKRFGMAENNNNDCRVHLPELDGRKSVFLSRLEWVTRRRTRTRAGPRCLRSKNIVRNNASILFIFLFLFLFLFFFRRTSPSPPRRSNYDVRFPGRHSAAHVSVGPDRPHLTVMHARTSSRICLFFGKSGRTCLPVLFYYYFF